MKIISFKIHNLQNLLCLNHWANTMQWIRQNLWFISIEIIKNYMRRKWKKSYWIIFNNYKKFKGHQQLVVQRKKPNQKNGPFKMVLLKQYRVVIKILLKNRILKTIYQKVRQIWRKRYMKFKYPNKIKIFRIKI